MRKMPGRAINMAHKELTDIQGGATGEYYHLTAEQYANFISGSGGGSGNGELGGGFVLKITFDAEFSGQDFTVTSSDSTESKTGVVPESLTSTVTVAKSNTTYTVTCGEYSATVTTSNYFGEYPVRLATFTATLTVTTNCPGCTITASAANATVTGTADNTGVAILILPVADIYTVGAATAFGITLARSETKTVIASNSDTYTATCNFTRLTVTSPADTTLSVNCDELSVSVVSTGSDTFYLPNAGECWVRVSEGTKTYVQYVSLTEYGDTSTTITRAQLHDKIYGVTWDGTSTTKWTRLDAATDFVDPVPYVQGATQYGSPFDDIYPWCEMTVEERIGGTMVKIPKFYYSLANNIPGVDGSGLIIRISANPFDGSYCSPAHMNRGDGKGERDVVYIARYKSASNMKSLTGQQPLLNTANTMETARITAHSLGTNIWLRDFATLFTIWLLYLVEFADWNSQKVIGWGGGSSVKNTGYTDVMPYHTGTIRATKQETSEGIQYRYIEGLWDYDKEWLDGCYFGSSNGLHVINNPSKFNCNRQNGIFVGNCPDSFPTALNVVDTPGYPVFYSSNSINSNPSPDEAYYVSDAWICRANKSMILCGFWGISNPRNGLFCLCVDSANGEPSYTANGRIMELPDAA